jgi:LysM repeat protein
MKPRTVLTFVVTLFCAGGMFAVIALVPLKASQAEPNIAQTLAIMDEQLKKLSAQIETLQFDQEQMKKQIADLEAQVVEIRSAKGAVSPADLQALEAKIKASDDAREKDKQAILDVVAKEIASLTGHTNSGSATTPPAGDGKEYVVQKGDTLTSVAKANGITVAQLKKANNLTTDALQVGQKLVVPKKAE